MGTPLFFISREGRKIHDFLTSWIAPSESAEWPLYFIAERLALKFSAASVVSVLSVRPDDVSLMRAAIELTGKKAGLPDSPDIDLRPYEDGIRYICERYVVADYSRIDALKVAALVQAYPRDVIERVADRCRRNGSFTIPYLAAALDAEGAKEIDAMRRENDVQELLAASRSPELPPKRFPGLLSSRIAEAQVEQAIDATIKHNAVHGL